MSRGDNELPYYRQRDFDKVETPNGTRYEPKRPALRALGKPPWTLKVRMFDSIIPQEATGLVGAIVWRGVRFVREDER